MPSLSILHSDRAKRHAVVGLCVLILLALGYWLYQRFTHVYTDDARIAADMVDIAAEVSGPLVSLSAVVGQRVQRGDVLARVDARKIEYQLEALDARLEEVRARHRSVEAERHMVNQQSSGALDAARSRLDAARALHRGARSDLELKQGEWRRARSLRERELIATQDWERTRSAWQQAQQSAQEAAASVAAAEAAVVEARALGLKVNVLDSDLAALEQQLARLRAERGRLQVELEQHVLRAPVAGVIDETFVNPGEHVAAGQRLLLMHDPDAIWVNANVKETDVRHLKAGQSVMLSVDAYPDRRFTGELVRIGDAATSEFALLPSTNPSGNFTKITQRLPLKIAVMAGDAWLRPGMMVEVSIDVRGS